MTKMMTSREFNQDVSRAKREAESGPVVITDRGVPSYVLLKHAEYQRLIGKGKSIVELLDMGDEGDFDFSPPKLKGPRAKDAGLE
jgi:hypothetical protein